MGELIDRQDRALKLHATTQDQRTQLETLSDDKPSEDWALLMAMELMCLTLTMKTQYQAAADVIVRAFCQGTNVRFEDVEAFVLDQTSAKLANLKAVK